MGRTAVVVKADVTHFRAISSLADEAAAALDGLSLLVNNADI
jgi:NAD(P)-dependent dehydrogenase (short-subunit alcohol dehydrogenase family)